MCGVLLFMNIPKTGFTYCLGSTFFQNLLKGSNGLYSFFLFILSWLGVFPVNFISRFIFFVFDLFSHFRVVHCHPFELCRTFQEAAPSAPMVATGDFREFISGGHRFLLFS